MLTQDFLKKLIQLAEKSGNEFIYLRFNIYIDNCGLIFSEIKFIDKKTQDVINYKTCETRHAVAIMKAIQNYIEKEYDKEISPYHNVINIIKELF